MSVVVMDIKSLISDETLQFVSLSVESKLLGGSCVRVYVFP